MGGTTRREPIDPIVTALANVRRSRGIDQRDLAARVGTAQSLISEWERGVVRPTLPSLRRWADALGYTLTILPRGES